MVKKWRKCIMENEFEKKIVFKYVLYQTTTKIIEQTHCIMDISICTENCFKKFCQKSYMRRVHGVIKTAKKSSHQPLDMSVLYDFCVYSFCTHNNKLLLLLQLFKMYF